MTREKHAAMRLTYPGAPLSARQEEAIRLLARGIPAKQAAYQMGVTIATFRKYTELARVKLRVTNTVGAIVKMYKEERSI